MTADQERTWERFYMSNWIFVKEGILHAFWFDEVHSKTKWVKKLLESIGLVQVCQNLDVIVHLMPRFIFYFHSLILFALLEFFNQIGQLVLISIFCSIDDILISFTILQLRLSNCLKQRKSGFIRSKSSISYFVWLHFAQITEMILVLLEAQFEIALIA